MCIDTSRRRLYLFPTRIDALDSIIRPKTNPIASWSSKQKKKRKKEKTERKIVFINKRWKKSKPNVFFLIFFLFVVVVHFYWIIHCSTSRLWPKNVTRNTTQNIDVYSKRTESTETDWWDLIDFPLTYSKYRKVIFSVVGVCVCVCQCEWVCFSFSFWFFAAAAIAACFAIHSVVWIEYRHENCVYIVHTITIVILVVCALVLFETISVEMRTVNCLTGADTHTQTHKALKYRESDSHALMFY